MSIYLLEFFGILFGFLSYRHMHNVSWSIYKSTTRYNGLLGLMPRCGYSSGLVSKSCEARSFGSRSLWRSNSLLSFQRHYTSHASTQQKSQKMLLYLTLLVFGMVGCTYAAVPLYRTFCQATGYGGTVQRREVRLCMYFIFSHNFLSSSVLCSLWCNCKLL